MHTMDATAEVERKNEPRQPKIQEGQSELVGSAFYICVHSLAAGPMKCIERHGRSMLCVLTIGQHFNLEHSGLHKLLVRGISNY